MPPNASFVLCFVLYVCVCVCSFSFHLHLFNSTLPLVETCGSATGHFFVYVPISNKCRNQEMKLCSF